MAEQQQDVDTLKRRGRRRLVGAVALALLAVIVLPMVLDPEPPRNVPPVSVRIPGEQDSAFAPKPVPIPEEKKAPRQAPAPVAKMEEKTAPKAKPAEKAAKPVPSERARAEAALADGQFEVQVGAYSSPAGVIARLAAARIPYYTEQAPGNLTRVRAGPFPTRDAAEKVAEKLKVLGLKPGAVTSSPG
jgi:DedD protein